MSVSLSSAAPEPAPPPQTSRAPSAFHTAKPWHHSTEVTARAATAARIPTAATMEATATRTATATVRFRRPHGASPRVCAVTKSVAFTEPDYEMQAMNNGGFAQQAADPNAILNDCQAIDRALDQIDSQLEQLTRLHKSAVNEPLVYKNQIDNLNNEIMTGYRGLVDRMRRIKGMPESGEPRNKPQVGRVDRRLKSTINKFQEVESKFRKELQESQARQYRIVRPDATDDEVKQAVEDPNAQIFQQAVCGAETCLGSGQASGIGNANCLASNRCCRAIAGDRRNPRCVRSRAVTRRFRRSNSRWLSWRSCSRT